MMTSDGYVISSSMSRRFPVAVLISLLVLAWFSKRCSGESILMITMGGTKSHKIPFLELGRGLARRAHNITFLNAFPSDTHDRWIEEINPENLVFYVRNYTNWDLLGSRMRGEEPVPFLDVLRYGAESCVALLTDHETRQFLDSGRTYDLLILDGAYADCALGFAHHYRAPYIFINTVGFYTWSLSAAGNPTPFATTPFFAKALTDRMSFLQRVVNTMFNVLLKASRYFFTNHVIHNVLKTHFGPNVPTIPEMEKNVSFILQNAHVSVSYSRPYLPLVAEIACIHCKPAKPLPKELEEFIADGGDAGFIYFSMGSSVKAGNMPEILRRLFLDTFSQLPYRVLWKWESNDMPDLPPNVKLGRWLPQQDLLGHPKIKAFVTHGGLLSMFETVYHAVPVVTMPVFCDHDSNAAKAELDGYAIKLEVQELTTEKLVHSIKKVIRDPRYRQSVKQRSILLRDQPESPLARAIYWSEYVIRHKGAYHLQSPAKDFNFLQFFLLDVAAFFVAILLALFLAALVAYRLASRLSPYVIYLRVANGKKMKIN